MSSNALPLGYELQDYSIESVLGTGGFGITYLAHDNQLGTRVAIKEYFPQDLARRNEQLAIVPLPGAAGESFEWGRKQFLKEARALAQFKHNNIVRVLRFLELNGTAYMIMEYEQGQGLLQYMKRKGQPDERMLLQVFLPILNGLQAVHRAGLLHLDIKPDNIYLRADGPPMLIDFGSVRHVARGAEAAGPVALTPAYAAIEQYPNHGKQGPWTDVYSIGASLYRCISGTDPVDALTRYQALRKRRPDPLPPASWLEQGGYSAYLRECVDWAMQVDPARRPQGAFELQEALMGKGRPQRKPAAPVRDRRDVPEPLASAASTRSSLWRVAQIAVVVLLVAGAVFLFQAYRDSGERLQTPPVAMPASAPTVATPSLTGPAAGSPDSGALPPAAPPAAQPFLSRDNPIRLIRTIRGHQDSVEALAFLADGGQLASASADGSIHIWDTQSGRLLRTLKGHRRSVNAIAVSPDGRMLASTGSERDVLLWDSATGKRLGSLAGHSYDVYALAFSPDGQGLASAGRDQTIILWDVTRRQAVRRLDGHDDPVFALAFSPDGEWLVSGGKGGKLKRWSVSTGREIASLSSHRGQAIFAVAVSPDGQWYASAGGDEQVRLWDAGSDQLKRTLAEAPGGANALAFSPDGEQLVGGGPDRILRAWDLASGTLDHEVPGHDGDIRAIALSAGRRTIASAGKDRTIRIWRAETR